VYFAQCPAHVLDTAQGKRADGTIEAIILEREPFTAKDSLVNLDPRLPDAPLRQAVHSTVGIDRRDLMDTGGVVGQVQAGPQANLQNLAADGGEQLLPMLRHQRPIQEKVAQARENNLGI
jgi:hypothetical protein